MSSSIHLRGNKLAFGKNSRMFTKSNFCSRKSYRAHFSDIVTLEIQASRFKSNFLPKEGGSTKRNSRFLSRVRSLYIFLSTSSPSLTLGAETNSRPATNTMFRIRKPITCSYNPDGDSLVLF